MSSIKITTKTEIEDCVCELSVDIEFTDIFRQLAKTTVHSYKEITDKGVYIIAGYKLGLEKCKVCELSVDIEFTDIFRQLAKTTVHSYKEITDKGVYIIAGYKLGLEKCKEIVVANPIEFTDIFRQLAKTTVHSYKEITDKGVYIIAGYKLGLEKCKEIVVANPDIEKVSFEEVYMEEIFEDIDRNIFPISVFEVIDAKLLWEILG